MHNAYYDNPALWNRAPEPYMVQMQHDLLDLLPHGVASLLDVGCGNGFVTNAFPPGLSVTGLDVSLEALRHVTAAACVGNICNLPFHDATFDLVMANDVLEHLPAAEYTAAMAELFRAGKSFVMITVPFLEDIVAGQLLCHNCGHVFHKNYHQRSFNLDDIYAMAPAGWSLAQVVFSGVEWDDEPLEMARLRQGLGTFSGAAYPCCPRCGCASPPPQERPQPDEIFWAISAYLSADKMRRQAYVSCRTEAICCFHRATRSNPWANIVPGSQTASLVSVHLTTEIDPLEIDFREHADWYQKDFLPTWGARAYFYVDKHIHTHADGLHLGAGQEVKLGFFVHGDAPVILEGTAEHGAEIEVRAYDLSGYQLVYSVHVQGDFHARCTETQTSFPLHAYGKLLAIRCAQGAMVLRRCQYAAHMPRQRWQRRQAEGQPRYVALPSTALPLALSTPYYAALLPTGAAALASIQARTEALQQLAKQPVSWPVVSWLVQSVAAWQRASVAGLDLRTRTHNLLQGQHTTLQGQHTTLQAQHTTLQAQHEAQRSTMEMQYNTLQAQYTTLETQHAVLQMQDSDLQTQLASQAARLAILEERLGTLRRLIAICSRLQRLWQRIKPKLKVILEQSKAIGSDWIQPLTVQGEATATVAVPPWESRTAVMLVPDDRIDRRVLLEARSLMQHGWKVTVIAAPPPTPDYRLDEDLFPEVQIVRVDASQAVHIPDALQSPCIPPGEENWQDFYWLTDHYYLAAAQVPSQVIVAHDLPVLPAALMAAALHQALLVYDAHELYPEQYHFGPEYSARCRRVESTLVPFAHHVITVNTSIAQEMAQRYHIAAPTIILNCPDYDPTHAAMVASKDLRSALGIAADRKILLFQGSLSLNRNLENLVHAMALITSKNVVLVFMGPGDTKRQELENVAMSEHLLGSVVYFHHAVPQCDVIPYTKSADAGIIPYPHIDLNSYYCTPNKLFDFLVAGIPILANDSPELKRYVADLGVGMVHNMSDASQIATAIDELFSRDHTAYKSRLHEIEKDYLWEREGQKLVDVYDKLVLENHNIQWPVKN